MIYTSSSLPLDIFDRINSPETFGLVGGLLDEVRFTRDILFKDNFQVPNNSVLKEPTKAEDICCETCDDDLIITVETTNPSNTIFKRLGFNYNGNGIFDYSCSTLEDIKSFPKLLTEWTYDSIKQSNADYLKNPVENVTKNIASVLTQIKNVAKSENLLLLSQTANSAYTNTILFLEHTNRLSGNTAAISKGTTGLNYNSGLAVGKIISYLVYQADGCVTSATVLGNFTSILVEKELNSLYDNIKSLPANTSSENANSIINTILQVDDFVSYRRKHDEGFFANSKAVIEEFNELKKFVRLGKSENVLISNYLASDKLRKKNSLYQPIEIEQLDNYSCNLPNSCLLVTTTENSSEPPIYYPPIANFNANSAVEGFIPLTVEFNNLSEHADRYEWDFTNNGTVDSTEKNPTHTYEYPGTYAVKLTAANEFGSNTITKTNYVIVKSAIDPVNFTCGISPLVVPSANDNWTLSQLGPPDPEDTKYTIKNDYIAYTVNGYGSGALGDGKQPVILDQDFDYAIIRFKWVAENGTDLDTRTSIRNTGSIYDNDEVGWARCPPGQDQQEPNSVGPYPFDLDEQLTNYLIWGGDNVSSEGAEGILINFKQIANDFPTLTEIVIDLKAFWYSTRNNGYATLEFETYLGGEMYYYYTYKDFDNYGGQTIQALRTEVNVVTNISQNVNGECVGTLVYDVATKTGRFEKCGYVVGSNTSVYSGSSGYSGSYGISGYSGRIGLLYDPNGQQQYIQNEDFINGQYLDYTGNYDFSDTFSVVPWEGYTFLVNNSIKLTGSNSEITDFKAKTWRIDDNHVVTMIGNTSTGFGVCQYFSQEDESIIRMRMTYVNSTNNTVNVKILRGMNPSIGYDDSYYDDDNLVTLNFRGLGTIPETDISYATDAKTSTSIYDPNTEKVFAVYIPNKTYAHNTGVTRYYPFTDPESVLDGMSDQLMTFQNYALVSAWDCCEVAPNESVSVCAFYICANNVTDLKNILYGKKQISAKFSQSTSFGYTPLTVNFTDESINANQWKWDFDDDGVIDSMDENPIYEFTDPGVYTITLLASNDDGYCDTYTGTVNAIPLIIADFDLNPERGFVYTANTSNTSNRDYFTTQTDNQSIGATNYEWYLDYWFPPYSTPSSTQENPKFTYTSASYGQWTSNPASKNIYLLAYNGEYYNVKVKSVIVDPVIIAKWTEDAANTRVDGPGIISWLPMSLKLQFINSSPNNEQEYASQVYFDFTATCGGFDPDIQRDISTSSFLQWRYGYTHEYNYPGLYTVKMKATNGPFFTDIIEQDFVIGEVAGEVYLSFDKLIDKANAEIMATDYYGPTGNSAYPYYTNGRYAIDRYTNEFNTYDVYSSFNLLAGPHYVNRSNAFSRTVENNYVPQLGGHLLANGTSQLATTIFYRNTPSYVQFAPDYSQYPLISYEDAKMKSNGCTSVLGGCFWRHKWSEDPSSWIAVKAVAVANTKDFTIDGWFKLDNEFEPLFDQSSPYYNYYHPDGKPTNSGSAYITGRFRCIYSIGPNSGLFVYYTDDTTSASAYLCWIGEDKNDDRPLGGGNAPNRVINGISYPDPNPNPNPEPVLQLPWYCHCVIGPIPTNQWNHFAVVRRTDPSTLIDSLNVYLNGVVSTNPYTLYQSIPYGRNYKRMGSHYNGGSSFNPDYYDNLSYPTHQIANYITSFYTERYALLTQDRPLPWNPHTLFPDPYYLPNPCLFQGKLDDIRFRYNVAIVPTPYIVATMLPYHPRRTSDNPYYDRDFFDINFWKYW